MNGSAAALWTSASARVARLPVRDARFWFVQIPVLGLAVIHLLIDIASPAQTVPAGVPVALLLAPVSYAALYYGLVGSVATALWATVIWVPDLMLSRDRGHVDNDLIELALVIAVVYFVGHHIDAERQERALAERARGEQQAAETRYRQLFDTNAAPILVARRGGTILEANPAALSLIPQEIVGRHVHDVLGTVSGLTGGAPGSLVAISTARSGTRSFRVNVAHLTTEWESEPLIQLVLEDVTAERAEGERVRRFAELLLKVQEEERRRIAHELHDEPLQLLTHLAGGLLTCVSPAAKCGCLRTSSSPRSASPRKPLTTSSATLMPWNRWSPWTLASTICVCASLTTAVASTWRNWTPT